MVLSIRHVQPCQLCANRGAGCILQISSVGGRLALPGSAGYHAAKWAVGGFTEALAQETAAFGVKVCALERFRRSRNEAGRSGRRALMLRSPAPDRGFSAPAIKYRLGS